MTNALAYYTKNVKETKKNFKCRSQESILWRTFRIKFSQFDNFIAWDKIVFYNETHQLSLTAPKVPNKISSKAQRTPVSLLNQCDRKIENKIAQFLEKVAKISTSKLSLISQTTFETLHYLQ